MSTVKDFKKELKELLTKYNAIISFSCNDNSDTHGLLGEKMIVEIRDDNGRRKTTKLNDGWHVLSKYL